MAMEIRAGYMNPPAPMGENKGMVTELQARQQQLQNELLLVKASGTDSAGLPPEKQEEMEDRLKEVSRQLRKARIDCLA